MSDFGLLSSDRKKTIPLKSVAVSGRIKGYVYGLDTKLSYLNTSDNPLEVVFRFPVDESTAVVGLEARIDGRTIKGEVHEKEEARQMYDDALSSGLTAALGEEKTGDIFSIALGNLPPKGEAEIVLKLCGEMPIDKDVEAARFTLPTVLKQRYTPTGSTDPLADIGGGGADAQIEKGTAPAVTSFSISVDRAEGVSSITSPTHDIKVCPKDDGTVDVTLKNSSSLDKDLVVLVQYQYCHIPRATVEKGSDMAKGNELMSNPAVMLEFFPKFSSLQAACEFLFVVDRSGSMAGNYINSAKETLVLFLKSIPPGCYFNIIGFGSRYEHLFPSSVPYNQSNLDKAMKHAQSMRADLGGTELLKPLEYIFSQKLRQGLPRQVFVLTDGSVSNTDACVSKTKKNASTSRVFTFGIGSGASSALVNGLARAGNGSAEFIKEGERMQGKVMSSLKKALQPSVTDVELKFNVPGGVEVVQAPNKIPPVFNGEKVVLYGWMKGGRGKTGVCSAVLKGNMLGSTVEHKIDFQLKDESLAQSDMPVVHQLAAKSLIQDWEGDKDMMDKKKAIIKLSIESSVVSSYTSYIAVDEDQNKPIEGAIRTYDLTAGVSDLFGFSSTPMSTNMFSSQSFGGPSYNQPAPMMQCFSFSGGGVTGSTGLLPQPMMGGLGGGGPPPPTLASLGSVPLGQCLPPQPPGGYYQPPPPPPSGGMFADLNLPPPPPPSGGFYGAPAPPPSMGSRIKTGYSQPPPPPPAAPSEDMLIDLQFDSFTAPVAYTSLGIDSTGSKNNHSSRSKTSSLTSNLFGDTGSDLSLSRLITLQSAEGFWSLNEALASVFGRPLSDLKASCPSGCSEVVWGTLLALAFLKSKCSSQRDEWELLSMKSEMWLQAQTIPTGTTIASLTDKAEQALA